MKKITPKKSSLFSILFFLELLSENPEDPTPSRTQPIQTPTFHCSRTLSTSEKLNFGGGLESTSSVEWKPRGT